MFCTFQPLLRFGVSLPSRGAWIEILLLTCVYGRMLSLPSRGAWIEIVTKKARFSTGHVAPLAGSVDRNTAFALPASGLGDRRSPRGERG